MELSNTLSCISGKCSLELVSASETSVVLKRKRGCAPLLIILNNLFAEPLS